VSSCLVRLAVLAAAVAVLPAVVWELGVELPNRVIDSGVEDFEGVEKAMARAALDKVYLETRETASFMVDKRVTRVGKCHVRPSGKKIEDEYGSKSAGFSAEVRPYTLFGIPEGKIFLSCRRGMGASMKMPDRIWHGTREAS
jgi:hypothetical protein